jgi:hypothetical protein
MVGEASARGERARELGKQARDRINADFNIDNPDAPPRASQKLVAAATLLRCNTQKFHHLKMLATIRIFISKVNEFE